MKAVPLFDTQLLAQLVCHIVDKTVEVAFNFIGEVLYVAYEATEKRAD
jgi:hypothetical protein